MADLPTQITSFIGRTREVAAARERLLHPQIRLVTFTGPGGIGKTRLALRLAHELLATFPDGTYFVSLAAITDPHFVASTIAQALEVQEVGATPLVATLKHHLYTKHLLLILDNFEQLLDAAPLVAELLSAAPQIKVLVTSRIPLHISGEHEYPVPSFALPNPKQLPQLESLSQYEAVALFIQRAQAVKSDFQITSTNAPAVAEICVRLDGLPLAIELAAARIKMLTPETLLARLGNRLKLLTGGARDVPARQQTLRNTIDWSYSLLDTGEQLLFARLAVFVGGATLDAIEAVCNTEGDLPGDPFDDVASLLDKSLLQQTEGLDGVQRFVMLETIHEYARERLEASGEAEILQRRHAEYFLALAEQAEPELIGPQQIAWLDRLEVEHDNIRAALRGSLAHGAIELVVRLSTAVFFFWRVRSYLTEARGWFMAVLATDRVPLSMRATVLALASALSGLQGDFDWAHAALEESITLSRQQANPLELAKALLILGSTLVEQGEYIRAEHVLEESLLLYQQLGDKHYVVAVLNDLGCIARDQGNYERAISLLEESLELGRELGDQLFMSIACTNLGNVAERQGDYERAKLFHTESLVLAQRLSDTEGFAYSFEGLAGIAGAQGQPERAARLFGVAEALRESINTPLSPADRRHHEHMVTTARTQLEEATWAVAWAAGRAMPLEQAIAYVREPTPEQDAPTPAPPMPPGVLTYPAGLTAREIDVLRLVAQGLTDAQVAEQLVVSPRTINAHLSSIYGKLGVKSRTAATRFAIEHNLV